MILMFLIQRDTTGLSSENTELKLRLQAMEQQAQLRDGKFSCTFRDSEYIYDSGNHRKPEKITVAPFLKTAILFSNILTLTGPDQNPVIRSCIFY